MHLLAHSMGGFDAVHAMEYARDKKEPPAYKYYGYGAIAAVGRNDFTPGPHNLITEFWSHRNEILENMNGELDVLKKSSGSLVRNPVLALFEAISAATASINEATLQLEEDGIFQLGFEVYGSHDRVVPKPKTRPVNEYSGHHMTPVYTPGITIDVARVITDSQSVAA